MDLYRDYNLTEKEDTLKKETEMFVERWAKITNAIRYQFKILEDASKSYGEFKGLL